jgi:hypothetical protein
MSFGDTPLEHLYTNSTQPYFHAPQILIALPMRFDPTQRILSDDKLRGNGIAQKMWKGVSDAVFLTSRGGNAYDRTFMDSFVRPGLDEKNWAARSQIVALGVVQTGPAEMSFYVNRNYGTKSAYVERMTLRLDGFASLHADRSGGSATTRPLRLHGRALSLNYATSPFGFVKLVLLDEKGAELPGFGAADAVEIKGDHVDRAVKWASGKTLADVPDQPVRLKFLLQDADLYSFFLGDGGS